MAISNITQYPGKHLLTNDLRVVSDYLADRAWIETGEALERVEVAGEGNMNVVLRAVTNRRRFILKQSVPWVAKYPSIAAPRDRALIEAKFYKAVAPVNALSASMPKLLRVDPEERVLMLEDLGAAENFSDLYAGTRELLHTDRIQLVAFLNTLHAWARATELRDAFSNLEMRALNHEHIFDLPLRADNGLDLDAITPGLAELAANLRSDSLYCGVVADLGALYLDPAMGECLIHGDYFPGSWLNAGKRIFIIDPEFCFFGPPEWDLGVMAAHLYLAGQSGADVERTLSSYFASCQADRSLVNRFTGVEIMRRLIGVAQLPVPFGLNRKYQLLSCSLKLVKDGKA